MEPVDPTTLVSLEGDGRGVRVLLSDGRVLELAAGSLPPALPVPGEIVPPELLASLEIASERKAVARQVFQLLDRRLRPRRDMERKLRERGYQDESISPVLDQFEEQGLLSDRRYAEAWCRDTLLSKAVGQRYLESKLRSKGVAPALAVTVSRECLDPETESELARRAATGWVRRQRGDISDVKTLAKGVRFLTSRGFPGVGSFDLLKNAAAALETEEEDS